MEFIRGDNFKNLSNNIDIFYCHTHQVNDFFKYIKIDNDFILISHNSDGKVLENGNTFPNADVNLIPNNLIKWFAQNVCTKHEKIVSIPIGLENSEWFVEIKKIEKIQNKLKTEKNYKNLLYINHNINTNLLERKKPYELLSDKNFVTSKMGLNGHNFDEYLDDIYNHKFVICPEGNGTDTHRTWECLYLDTIPIEKRNINNSFYEDLPICFVDDWNEINENFLEKEYKRIKSKVWNKEKAYFKYWRERIVKSL